MNGGTFHISGRSLTVGIVALLGALPLAGAKGAPSTTTQQPQSISAAEVPAPDSQSATMSTPQPASKALLNTLEKLHTLEQRQALKVGVYPSHGSIPKVDGNSAPTPDQRAMISARVQRCWTYDPKAKGVDQMRVVLDVTVDANGIAREAIVDPADPGNMNDPVFRAFVQRALRAVLNPVCARLPLPPQMLGQVRTFKFRFSPL